MPEDLLATRLAVSPRPRIDERYAIVLVCVIVALVYATLIRAPSLIWDDDLNIFENPFYTAGQLGRLWTEPYFGMYIPVTSAIWGALFVLGAGAAWPFRVLNIVLHVANVAMFALLLTALLRRWRLSSGVAVAIGVAIFALHPQQTAAVSWISGGRDLAAALFSFAAIGTYFARRRWHAVLSTVLFVAALLSKPSAVVVPLVVVAFTLLFERERWRESLAVGAGWMLLSLAAILATRSAQAEMFTVQVPLWRRPAIAVDALGFYVIKSVWPFPLAADYGRTPDFLWSHPSVMAPTFAAAAAALALSIIAMRRDQRFRIVLLWPILLLPVLGLVPFPYQRISTVADHYAYLPLAVVASLVAVAVARSKRLAAVAQPQRLAGSTMPGARGKLPDAVGEARESRAGWAVFAVLVIALATSSWVRTVDWSDNEHFFSDMLQKNPRSFPAVVNIAAVQCDRGNWSTGLSTIQRVASVARSDAAFLANETYCLFRGSQYQQVFARQQRLLEPSVVASLDSNPSASAVLANSFAGAFLATGRTLPAFAYLCQAAALSPGDPDIARNVALAREELRRRGREVTCRGKVRWDMLEQIVAILK